MRLLKRSKDGFVAIADRVLFSGKIIADSISLIYLSGKQSRILSREDQVTRSLKKGRVYPLELSPSGFINSVYHV